MNTISRTTVAPASFATGDQRWAAESAGYRASRRMGGDPSAAARGRAALIARACRQIEPSETLPNLEELAARAAAMSPFHFHRVFKAETGLTPKGYASASRARKLRQELSGANTTSVTDAIYGAGFNSNSRFYENSAKASMCFRCSWWRCSASRERISRAANS